MTNTPRALLIEDYREKCAKMEDDMLGWKESAEAWERDARGLSDRLKWMADRQRDLLALVDKQAAELAKHEAVWSDPAMLQANLLHRGALSRMNALHIAGATDYDTITARAEAAEAE